MSVGPFEYGPVENCIKDICMAPSSTLDPESTEILETWAITFFIWLFLFTTAFLLVKWSKGDLRDWVMATPYYSGIVGLGTLWFSVFIGGFVIPDGQFGAWTHSLRQYTNVSVLVYYQPVRTLVPLGFSVATFGGLVALAEGWKRLLNNGDSGSKDYKIVGLFIIIALLILAIPIFGVIAAPSNLNAVRAWGLTFFLSVIVLSTLFSILEVSNDGSGLSGFSFSFLLSMWATLVIAGSFWVEASLSFARHIDRPIHLDASYASFLFTSLVPLFGSMTLFYSAQKKSSATSFESRLLLISVAILFLVIAYVIFHQAGIYKALFDGNYNNTFLGLHQHIILSLDFIWLTYFGTELIDD